MRVAIVVVSTAAAMLSCAGASAVIGTELLAKSPPDGHTLMLVYSTHATNPIFIPKLPYDTLNDLDRKSTRLNSSHSQQSRMPSSA